MIVGPAVGAALGKADGAMLDVGSAEGPSETGTGIREGTIEAGGVLGAMDVGSIAGAAEVGAKVVRVGVPMIVGLGEGGNVGPLVGASVVTRVGERVGAKVGGTMGAGVATMGAGVTGAAVGANVGITIGAGVAIGGGVGTIVSAYFLILASDRKQT